MDAMADFDDFYHLKYKSCLALAYARLGNWADAEDVAQDAFADAARNWAKVSQYEEPAAYVLRAVMNRASSRWRRVGREVKALALMTRPTSAAPASEAFDEEFWDAVRRLPKQQSKAVVLFYVADMSIAHLAIHLGCSEGAAKSHLSRARATLEMTLSHHNDKENDHD